MAALKNPKWETFAQALARGVPMARAYQEAGFKPHPSNPSAYAKKHEIAARVAELVAEREAANEAANAKAVEALIEQRGMDQETLLNRMLEIAEIGDGRRLVKKTIETDDGKRATVEVTHLDLRTSKLAYEAFGQQAFGMFMPKTKADVSVNGPAALDPDTRAKIAALVRGDLPTTPDETVDAGADAEASPSSVH
jgi:CRP-like cAMP-binding protein